MRLSPKMFAAMDRVQSGFGRTLRIVAQRGIGEIKKRTLSGRDRYGKYFIGYKPSYQQRKKSSHVDIWTKPHQDRKKPYQGHLLDGMTLDVGNFSEFNNGQGRFRDTGGSGRFVSARDQKASITFETPAHSRVAGAIISGKGSRGRLAGPRPFFGLSNAWVDREVDKEFRGIFAASTRGITNDKLEVKLG